MSIQKLVRRWVRDCLIQQPVIFDKAYNKLFSMELQSLKTREDLLPDAWAVRRFWQPGLDSEANQPKQKQKQPQAMSRYASDFQVKTNVLMLTASCHSYMTSFFAVFRLLARSSWHSNIVNSDIEYCYHNITCYGQVIVKVTVTYNLVASSSREHRKLHFSNLKSKEKWLAQN